MWNSFMLSAGGLGSIVYDPYGHEADVGVARSLLGFNGQLRHTVTGLYMLGNGYRLYSAGVRRFCSADVFSPFGAGGLNCYAYCSGDPINFSDPTGAMSWNPSRKQPEIFTIAGRPRKSDGAVLRAPKPWGIAVSSRNNYQSVSGDLSNIGNLITRYNGANASAHKAVSDNFIGPKIGAGVLPYSSEMDHELFVNYFRASVERGHYSRHNQGFESFTDSVAGAYARFGSVAADEFVEGLSKLMREKDKSAGEAIVEIMEKVRRHNLGPDD